MKTFDHLYSYKTYAGCYEGIPPHYATYDGIKNRIKKLWGVRPVYMMNEGYTDETRLPEWTHIVWANGPEKDPENHGSQLVIIWFSDSFTVDIENIINKVDWEKYAEDWQI